MYSVVHDIFSFGKIINSPNLVRYYGNTIYVFSMYTISFYYCSNALPQAICHHNEGSINLTPSPIAQSVAYSYRSVEQEVAGSIPGLGQYSSRGLTIVIATGFILLSPLSIVLTILMWESSQWLGKNNVRSTGKTKSRKAWIGALARRDSIETTLKTPFNQSTINLTIDWFWIQHNP